MQSYAILGELIEGEQFRRFLFHVRVAFDGVRILVLGATPTAAAKMMVRSAAAPHDIGG
jgi:hypothetical protein